MELYYPSKVWKYCPYCGSKQISWGADTHMMLCNLCKKTFYINSSAAVVALIKNENGELLFTRRKNNPAKGMLDLPGGFVDICESAEDAMRREIKEELNIITNSVIFFASFPNRYLYDGIVYFTTDIVFYCQVNDFSTLKAADDVSEYVFISTENIRIEDIGLDSIQAIICKIKNTKGIV